MNSVLSRKDPTAMLHAYAAMPSADPHFIETAYDWYKNLDKQGTEDQLDTGAAAGVIASIARGDITSAPQILQGIDAAGITGKAKSQMIERALGALKSVQSTNQDDPAMKASPL